MIKRGKLTQAIVCGLIFFFAAGVLFGGGQEEKPFPIKVDALKGPTGIGMIKLFDSPPDLGEGAEAEYSIASSPDVVVSRLLSEEVDIAVLPANVAVKLYNKGVPYKLGAVVGNGLLYLLSSDPDIRSLADLAGKEVFNVGKGATPDFVFRYLLEKENLDSEKDVSVNFTYPHPELAQMLIAGKVKTGILPEPFVTMVLAKSESVTVAVDLQQAWKAHAPSGSNYPMSVVVIKKDLADEHPEVVDRFLQEYENSINWVRKNPDSAGEAAERNGIGMTAAIASAAVPRLNLTFLPGREARPVMERFLNIFLEFDPGAIGGKLPDPSFYLD